MAEGQRERSHSELLKIKNLFSDIPESLPEEATEVLLETENLRLERIISDGQSTPAGEWYDQETDEWVLLLKGRAALRFEGDPELRTMHAGDALLIPAHVRHRVEWTDKGAKTIWLALHFHASAHNMK